VAKSGCSMRGVAVPHGAVFSGPTRHFGLSDVDHAIIHHVDCELHAARAAYRYAIGSDDLVNARKARVAMEGLPRDQPDTERDRPEHTN